MFNINNLLIEIFVSEKIFSKEFRCTSFSRIELPVNLLKYGYSIKWKHFSLCNRSLAYFILELHVFKLHFS